MIDLSESVCVCLCAYMCVCVFWVAVGFVCLHNCKLLFQNGFVHNQSGQ